MAFSPAFADLGTGSTPLDWPGSANLLAWYHWRYDRQFSSTLFGTGATTPPAVTFTGTVPIGCGLRLDMPTGGVRGTAQFRWSARNGDGTDWSSPITTASSVNLGNGITLQFSNSGTYATDNDYNLIVTSWRDQTGNAHHFNTVDGAPIECPYSLVTPYGTGLSFDGTNDMLQCNTGLANSMVGGSDNNFAAFQVVKIDNTSPSSGAAGLLFFGNTANNRLVEALFLSTPAYRVTKTDDAASTVSVTGGTPNTSIHILRFVHTGTTTQIFVDGTSVVGPTAQDVGSLTGINNATIGGTFLSSAKGNRGAMTFFEMALYSSHMDAVTCADIESRMRAPYGF